MLKTLVVMMDVLDINQGEDGLRRLRRDTR
jgi:hypothetical protein|eukprot:COSAG06_NODE_1355_length_9743_cov_3.335061_3_plen_30_part_00